MKIAKFEGLAKLDKRRCRVCGCTQFHACPGGCYWVEYDLCSQCRYAAMAPTRIFNMLKDYIDQQVPIFITSQECTTGKTTLLNELASYIPNNEKVFVIPEKTIEEFTFRFDYAFWTDFEGIKHIYANQGGLIEQDEFTLNHDDWIVIDGPIRLMEIGINSLFKRNKLIFASQLPFLNEYRHLPRARFNINEVLKAFQKRLITLPDEVVVIQTERMPVNQRINDQFSTRIHQVDYVNSSKKLEPYIENLYIVEG